MSSWLEKYRYYEKGIVKPGTTIAMQKLFKTKISEDQLMLLDEVDKSTYLLVILAVILYFGFGLLVGYMIWHAFPEALLKLAGA